MKLLESGDIEGDIPVTEIRQDPRVFLSNTAHVERRMNLRGPPRKAKYELATDSELVPRGKGEKNRCERSEIDLQPCAYKVSEPARVMACLLLNESAS